MMKQIIFIFLVCVVAIHSLGQSNPNGPSSERPVVLSGGGGREPHFAQIADPVAMYNTATQDLTVTLDAVYYPQFTICLEGQYTSVEYFCFSPVVCMPTASMGDVVTIYIESDDCGSWYGELDKAYFGGPISN